MTDAARLAAVLALLRRRVASGDVRASVLREVEALSEALQPEPPRAEPAS